MSNIRFISSNELHLVYELFSVDNNLVRQEMTVQDLDSMLSIWKENLDAGLLKIAMLFNDNEPVLMYTGLIVPEVSGWLVGATKVKQPTSNFYKTAKIAAPVLDFLFDYMESLHLFKVWMMGPETHHNIRNQIMTKYSTRLPRYHWYDEEVIPIGCKSKTPLFDRHRVVCNWSDILVRMFVLDQISRKEWLSK